MSYQFLDANSSILTADSSIISGSGLSGIQRPIINIGSVLGPFPVQSSGNQSVSGQVGASLIGQLPAGTAVLGSVMVLQGTDPWNVRGSVSGTVDIGTIPGSVIAFQGTSPWITRGSVSGTVDVGVIPGSVLAFQGGARITSIVSSIPSSVLVGASIFGMLPAGTQVLGSILVLQGTNPWNISSVYGNVSGSVLAQQLGTAITSVVSSNPSSLLSGVYGHRNDAIASYLGGNLSWRPITTDSAGRIITKPFSPEESRIEGYASTVNVSVTTLVPAAGAGLRNYITDIWLANTGAAATLVTFRSQGGASVLGYTIAPAGSGSNLQGLVTPIRTGANETFDIQASTGTSVLYATVKGFKAP